MFVLYPEGARKIYVYYFILLIFVMSCHYVYSLFIYELAIDPEGGAKTFNDILIFLGLGMTEWN